MIKWVPISEALPTPFRLVALIDVNSYQNIDVEYQIPVARIGFWNNSFGGFWCCYGERALDKPAFTHWARLPKYEQLECFNV